MYINYHKQCEAQGDLDQRFDLGVLSIWMTFEIRKNMKKQKRREHGKLLRGGNSLSKFVYMIRGQPGKGAEDIKRRIPRKLGYK